MIERTATEFYNFLKQDEYGRYRSWEHCYANFTRARKSSNPDYDYLSLQLAFYLASWGMYRGSSFLLQKDYRIHIPVVKELLSSKYDTLAGIACCDFRRKECQKLLIGISTFMSEYYDAVRKDVKEQDVKNQLSETLITKILMGTLGCVPAYDRYFISGVKNQNVTTGRYNIKSILKLVDFYEANLERLEAVRKNMVVYEFPYPQMKLLDMGFWQIGFELDENKGLQIAH